MLRASTIFRWSKRSIDGLDIKINDLDLSTRGFVDIFLNSCFAELVLKVLFSLGILPLMLGWGGGRLYQRRGVIHWK